MTDELNRLSVLAETAVIQVPDADIDPLLAALQNHLEAVQALTAVSVDEIEPILEFDPRWT